MSDFNSIRFLSGRPLLRELGADRLNTILTEIKRNKPKGERGITVRQDGTGTYIGLAASLPSGTGTPTTLHPFQVLLRQFEEEGPWFWGVINNSKLFRDITGYAPGLDGRLGAEASDEDPNWLQIDTGDTDYIYIEYDATENTYTINSTGNGGGYNGDTSFPAEESEVAMDFTTTPATLLFARKVIATAEAPEEEGQAPIITQGIKQHQLVQDVVYQGYPVRYFFDYTSI